jgi:membrane protein
MVIGSAIFNFYLRHFGDYPRFYGTMAGFIILMFWIYLASLILLIGAETDSVIERTRQRQTGASRAWSGSQHRP